MAIFRLAPTGRRAVLSARAYPIIDEKEKGIYLLETASYGPKISLQRVYHFKF